MNWLLNLVVMLQILAALVMIGLVLVQHGKGADMGASFGSGASGSLFGATGSANFLSRTTAILATVFFLSSLGLTYLASMRTGPQDIMKEGAGPAAAQPAAKDAKDAKDAKPSDVPQRAAPAAPAAPAKEPDSKPSDVPK